MGNIIFENFTSINKKINEISTKVGRNSEEIKLVTVTKLKSPDEVTQVINAGAKILGENYPEETDKKIKELGPIANDVQWHMIGHLQSRKIKYVVEHYSMIHSIDSFEIARDLNNQLAKSGKVLPALFEVNVSGEETKHGFLAVNRDSWGHLIDQWSLLMSETKNLAFVGLMTMPPYAQKAEDSRRYFKKCRELMEYFVARTGFVEFKELSMGTSLDFPMAIEEGATFIRIGEAIMGKRNYI
jgi:pyridoxal phosphate enzyme (YggS family)